MRGDTRKTALAVRVSVALLTDISVMGMFGIHMRNPVVNLPSIVAYNMQTEATQMQDLVVTCEEATPPMRVVGRSLI
jgi:hypothetical protein